MCSMLEEPTHAFTVRIPHDVYTALRSFAFYTDTSMNNTIIRSLRAFLDAYGEDDELKAMVEEARRKFQEMLERQHPTGD